MNEYPYRVGEGEDAIYCDSPESAERLREYLRHQRGKATSKPRVVSGQPMFYGGGVAAEAGPAKAQLSGSVMDQVRAEDEHMTYALRELNGHQQGMFGADWAEAINVAPKGIGSFARKLRNRLRAAGFEPHTVFEWEETPAGKLWIPRNQIEVAIAHFSGSEEVIEYDPEVVPPLHQEEDMEEGPPI